MMPVSSDPEILRGALSLSVDALHRRQASEIPEALLEELIERDWLEWHGGSLRLTTTGENIYRRERAQSKTNAIEETQGHQAAPNSRRS